MSQTHCPAAAQPGTAWLRTKEEGQLVQTREELQLKQVEGQREHAVPSQKYWLAHWEQEVLRPEAEQARQLGMRVEQRMHPCVVEL